MAVIAIVATSISAAIGLKHGAYRCARRLRPCFGPILCGCCRDGTDAFVCLRFPYLLPAIAGT